VINFLKNKSPWVKNLFFIALSQFIVQIGMSGAIPFLPLFIKELGITSPEEAKLWSGLVFAAPYFTSIFAAPFWGWLGDKYGRKLMLIRALVGLLIITFLISISQNIYQLFALRIIQGIVSGMLPAGLAFITSDAPSNKTGYAIGIMQTAMSAGGVFGPIFGGFIADILGIRPVFQIISILIIINLIFIIYFLKEQRSNLTQKSSTFLSNISLVRQDGYLTTIMILIIITQAGLHLPNPILPFFVESKGADPNFLSTMTGILLSIGGFIGIFTAPRWGKLSDKKNFYLPVFLGTLMVGIAYLAHTFICSYESMIILRIVIGLFYTAIVPSLYNGISKKTNSKNIGGLFGIATSANTFGSLISFTACGYISAYFGMDAVFYLAALLLIGSSISIIPIVIKFNKK